MVQLIADSLSRLLGAKALPSYPPFAIHCEGIFLPGEKMILVISATYLCRCRYIDDCIYAAISIFGFFEIITEVFVIVSVLGK